MAAVISAVNAKIRSQPVLNYVCSTHFWGPVSNFGIPIAAVMDTQKDPEIYGGREASLEAKAKTEASQIAQDGKSIAGDAKAGAEGIIGDVKQKAGELKQKVVK
ncbi:hypothetical protein IMSHALPRED_002661 [Imshaugia aleurites]|uniref:Mitochondrial pyruvate carrier n=1 Tax=Imshaugia aleurites TaxID=172621 RepID=A0A8H3EY19_9LECA|nr:hypothetical protein IMSHALPRED_002661 [Imshaugia aleurites]